MKGLILKDIYAFMKIGKIYLLIMVVYTIWGALAGNRFFVSFAAVFMAMLPITMMGIDEKAGWNAYSVMLPVTRKDIVASKYIVGLLGIVLLMVLYMILAVGQSVVKGSGFALMEELKMVVSLTTTGCLVMGVNLPIMFKLGSEKGRLFYFIFMGIAMAVTVGVDTFLTSNEVLSGIALWIKKAAQIPAEQMILASLLLSAAILAASLKIAYEFFRKKEL